MIRFNAHFDGKNICPDEPVSLPENVPLRITVDTAKATPPPSSDGPIDLFERLESEFGLINGPSDWAAEHDHYLYARRKSLMNPPSDRLFLDTGYVIARFNRRDQHHEMAERLAGAVATCRELWTTDAVLFEVGAAFAQPNHRSIFVNIWDEFHGDDGRFQVAEILPERLNEAVSLFRQRTDKSWSLTDCLSFVVMNEQQLTDALTPDQHFMQAGFRALMTDA